MTTDRQQDTAKLCKGDKKKHQQGRRLERQEMIRKDCQHCCDKIQRKVVSNSDVNPSGERTELSRVQEAGKRKWL